jgi:putative zinc finger protein
MQAAGDQHSGKEEDPSRFKERDSVADVLTHSPYIGQYPPALHPIRRPGHDRRELTHTRTVYLEGTSRRAWDPDAGGVTDLNCEDFEARVSAYLDGELTSHESGSFLQHTMVCPSCGELVDGVRAVRAALHGLGAAAAPAHYQLRLAACVQERLERASLWLRSLALWLALTAAAAILLWPEVDAGGPPQALPSGTLWANQATAWSLPRAGDANSEWPQTESGHARIGRYSHAAMRLASF